MAAGIPARLSRAEGRRFAWTVGAAFLVLAVLGRWRGHPTTSLMLATLGGLLALAGLAIPGSLTGVHRAWMGLAHAISKITTPIFLGVVYFVVMTPVGWLMRAFGHHPLAHRRVGDSYFTSRAAGTRRSNLERQF